VSWTQAICNNCWSEWYEYEPFRTREPEVEICCYCGQETLSGIYVRIDPKTVPFPRKEEL